MNNVSKTNGEPTKGVPRQRRAYTYNEAISLAQLGPQYNGVNVSSINDLVKGDAAQKNPHTLAFREVNILQGVSLTARNALEVLRVKTVYDLATSTLFGSAANIYRAAVGPGAKETLYGKLNHVPAHLVDPTRLSAAQLAERKAAEDASAGKGAAVKGNAPADASRRLDDSSKKRRKEGVAGDASGHPKKGKHKKGHQHRHHHHSGSDTGKHGVHGKDADNSDSSSDSDNEGDAKPADKARAKPVKQNVILDLKPAVILMRPANVLAGFGGKDVDVDALQSALRVTTVRDLALYPPFVAAQKLLAEAYMPDRLPDFDPEAPEELLPKVGVYATEKVFYNRVYMDQVSVSGLKDISTAGMVDLQSTDTVPPSLPAIGAIVTYEQAWYQEGVALGDLLHSVALAPGEGTRIAITTGSRTSTTTTTQDISQTEALDTTSDSSRAIQDVTKAVASKASSTNSVAEQSDTAAGGTVSGGGSGFGASGSFSASTYMNWSKSTAEVDSAASSNMGSEGNQSITASTHQAAMSSRNRRASAVSEVRETGRVEQSTRVVANNNHMHALTVQYYEVVQTYRVTTSVSQVSPVVFLPVQIINPWMSPDIWWRQPLLSAALPTTELQKNLKTAFNSNICIVMPADDRLAVEVPQSALDTWKSSEPPGADPGVYRSLHDVSGTFKAPPVIDGEPYNWRLPQQGMYLAGLDVGFTWKEFKDSRESPTSHRVVAELFTWSNDTVLKKDWQVGPIAADAPISQTREQLLASLRQQSWTDPAHPPKDPWVGYPGFQSSGEIGDTFKDWGAAAVQTLKADTWEQNIYSPDRSNCIPLDQVDRLAVTVSTPFLALGDNRVSVCLSLRHYADESSDDYTTLEYTCTSTFMPGYEGGNRAYQERHTVMHILPDNRPATGATAAGNKAGYLALWNASRAPGGPRVAWLAVLAELNSNPLRYNQALWAVYASYDAQRMAPVLAAHSYQGLPLLGQVDPQPVALMGRHIGFKLGGDGIMHDPDGDMSSGTASGNDPAVVTDYKNTRDKLSIARQAQAEYDAAAVRADAAESVVRALRGLAANKTLYPGLQALIDAAAAAAAARTDQDSSIEQAWSTDEVWWFVPQLALAMRLAEPARQLMTSFGNYVCIAPGRSGIVYLDTLDMKLVDQARSLPRSVALPRQFKDDSWRLPQKGLYLYAAEVDFKWKARGGVSSKAGFMTRACIYTASNCKWHILAAHKRSDPSDSIKLGRPELVTRATGLATKSWECYDGVDERAYLPQTDIARYKAGNRKPWIPGSGKRDDCIPLDMIDRIEFSTNVPDALLGDHTVYVTLILRYYNLEGDDAHYQFERTLMFSMEGSIPSEPKTLVNFFLDRRADSEAMTYDSRDSTLQGMSDALRADMTNALTELGTHSSRYHKVISDYKKALEDAKKAMLPVVPSGQPAPTTPWTSADVWYNVPFLAAEVDDDTVRKQLMVSFDNCICLAPSRKDLASGDPKLPNIRHMIYKDANLDIPLARQAAGFEVPKQYLNDSWRVPQKGMYLYNLEVDFRWLQKKTPPASYSCRTITYGWGPKQVLAKTVPCAPAAALSPTREELLGNLRPQQRVPLPWQQYSFGYADSALPAAVSATKQPGDLPAWQPLPDSVSRSNLIPLDQIDHLLFATDVPDDVLGEHYVYVSVGLRYYPDEGIDKYTQVDRILCFTMDGPIKDDPKTMLDFFLDRGQNWTTDPYDDKLREQSAGMRKDWSEALEALNRDPAKYHQAVDAAKKDAIIKLPASLLPFSEQREAQADREAADIAQEVVGSGSAGIGLAFQKVADAHAALEAIEATRTADGTTDVAAVENELRKFRIKAKTNWPLWCAIHGLGVGDDTPATETISLPTGGVFAEAVLGRFNAAEMMDNRRYWNWNDNPIPLQAEDLTPEQIQFQSVQPLSAGQLQPSIIPQDIPDNGKFPAFNMATRLANLNQALAAIDQSTSGGMQSILMEAQRLSQQNQLNPQSFMQQLGGMAGTGSQGPSGPRGELENERVFKELEKEGMTNKAVAVNLGKRMARARALYMSIGNSNADPGDWLPGYQEFDREQLEGMVRQAAAAATQNPNNGLLVEKARSLDQRVRSLYGEGGLSNDTAAQTADDAPGSRMKRRGALVPFDSAAQQASAEEAADGIGDEDPELDTALPNGGGPSEEFAPPTPQTSSRARSSSAPARSALRSASSKPSGTSRQRGVTFG
ncbi:hypothetical protein WJX75_004378 [Coccomyxa subellipsoidea]|uniref:Uncharacterized protein n=1 Tax=Coccomyxa subellipsoidea TaxID=248742 RepID=A0ABR2YWV5_9CHLO